MTDVFPGASVRQLVEWGYPMGQPRPTPPPDKAISVVHITGNPGNPIATAAGELAWRYNDPALQNSATFFVDRDGSAKQALLDPAQMDPWANGDVQNPDMSNPRIAAIVRDGVNANERTLVAIENVGRPVDLPLTEAQMRKCGEIIGYYHRKAGVPINRQTVVGHYQLNAVDRPNCPAIDKSVLDKIIAYASPEENDVYDWVPKMTYQIPKKAVVAAGTVLLDAPGDPRFKLSADTTVEVIGDLPGVGWVGRRDGGPGLFIVPRAGVKSWVQPATGGITQETVDKARLAGRTEGADAVLEAAKTAAGLYGAT